MKHLRLLPAVLLLFGIALAPGPLSAQGLKGIDLQAADPGSVRFTIRFDEPAWAEVELNGRPYRHLVWPGLALDGAAGSPELPGRVARVALPPGGEPALSIEVEPGGRAQGLRFPPAPGPAPGVADAAARRAEAAPPLVFVEGPAYGIAAPNPQAEILAVGNERGMRVANVLVRPVAWNPVTGEAVWARKVTVTLRVSGALPGAAALPARPGRAEREGWSGTLVNAAEASVWQVPDCDTVPQPNAPDGLPGIWFDDAQGWLRIEIAANGVYRVNRQALVDAGVEVSAVDPRSLRLFAGPLIPEVPWADLGWRPVPGPFGGSYLGSNWLHVYERPEFTAGFAGGTFDEIPILVTGESDGKLDAADGVVFYALGPDNYRDRFGLALNTQEDFLENPYSDHTVYWLAWGGSFPTGPLRMAQVAATPAQGAPLVTESLARLHVEENSLHDPSLFESGVRWETWFWDDFASDSAPRGKQVALPHAVAGSALDLRIRLWGANVPDAVAIGEEAKHHVQVDVNGAPAPLAVWGGTAVQSYTHRDVVLSGLPMVNPTTITFTVPEVGTSETRVDLIYLAWMDFVYRRALDAGALAGEFEIDAGEAGRSVRIARPPAGSLLLFDVSDPRRPRQLTGSVLSGSGAAAAAEFALDRAEASVVAFAGASAVPAPASVTLKTPPSLHPGGSEARWLRDTREPLDYVIVAYDDFVEEAELLAAWRREHLYGITDARAARVRVVRVRDVMDEFAGGMWDPIALRYFLEYAYRYYGICGSDDRPTYCLFLGDHSYDFRDHERSGIRDLVPSWEDNRTSVADFSQGNVHYVTDDPLARFHGPFDRFTDLYIGRITATTRQEARDVIVDKVIRSENEPTYGPWRTKAILVADDICQAKKPDSNGFLHMSQTEAVDATIPAAFDRRKIYLYDYGEACIYDGKPEAKRDLLRAWSDGAWLVNYTGHGADIVLADEHVFDLTDIPVLSNANRLPIFTAFSCSVGKFSKTAQQGIGEALVLAHGTGVLMSAAATHLTYSGSNTDLNIAFVAALFPDAADPSRTVPAGVALMQAKRLRYGDDKYVCLGDPASRINTPGGLLELEGPAQIERGGLVDLRVEVPGAGPGEVDLLAQDARFLKSKNSQGVPIPIVPPGGYYLPGATIYRGVSTLQGDTTRVRFTVPVALRGGPDGRMRVYAAGDDWDAFGTMVLPVTAQTTASPDSLGPEIGFSGTGGTLRPGQQVEVLLEDPAGINLTGIFEFLSVLLRVFDETGLERVRQDVTSGFAYDSGSSTSGRVVFAVPDLEPGRYTLIVSAADNYNNRTQASLEVQVGEASAGGGFASVAAYPNPFDPDREPTRILFTLDDAAHVTVRVYSVSGRLVRRGDMEAASGGNAFMWDGKDEAGDAVANGVYLVHLTASGSGGAKRHLERVAVVR